MIVKPSNVCRFINDIKYADVKNNILKPKAFYKYKKFSYWKTLLYKIFKIEIKIKNDKISLFVIDKLKLDEIKSISKYRKLNAIGRGDLKVIDIENIIYDFDKNKKLLLKDYNKSNKNCSNNFDCKKCKKCIYHCMINPNINAMEDDLYVVTELSKISKLELF
ncbi:MAG: hypothetical protein Ta2D_10510 [Rickettsiales bacterium]|nr:MAG: hypothetical protein Ta2D_10510 [Rickettsiales bacterium]